ncbi:Hypothetical protein CM240_3334 [Clostridium bornimense]|uniref:Sortilin N-terminal domain-containing protein n=1 Tax=Clostridium bornimense TaxID=1216932 RepID=W6S0M1_9CLOT|nr:YCF48-related protein [Clostridium bornimense]CDM70451.1 Hypothetical protein CM240_3334 [Clostridium bornimense]
MKMKKILLLLGVMMIITNSIGCGNEKAKNDWNEFKTVTVSNQSYIGGFNDENFGITVGYAGESKYSTDGGKTWSEGKNSSLCRFGLAIINDKVAYSCGNGSNVRKTKDGGKTWEAIKDFGKSEPNQCRYLSFINENEGIIASPEQLGITKDSGKEWIDITLPKDIGNILGIFYSDKKVIYIVDSNKKIYISKNAGDTWESKDLKADDMNTTVSSESALAIHFDDENNGRVFYYTSELVVKSVVTKDGGSTWKDEKVQEVCGQAMFLSQDGKLLSVNSSVDKSIILLKGK